MRLVKALPSAMQRHSAPRQVRPPENQEAIDKIGVPAGMTKGPDGTWREHSISEENLRRVRADYLQPRFDVLMRPLRFALPSSALYMPLALSRPYLSTISTLPRDKRIAPFFSRRFKATVTPARRTLSISDKVSCVSGISSPSKRHGP